MAPAAGSGGEGLFGLGPLRERALR